MPLKVRIKIIVVILLAALVGLALGFFSPWWGISFLILAILYAEMIYPKWNFFGQAILNVKDKGPHKVALTFDDGPSPWTEDILDELKRRGVKASFFVLGKNVERYPEIAQRIKNEGHHLGVHAYSHQKLHWKGPEFIREELDKSETAFQRFGIAHDPLIRFPHGFKNIFCVLEAKRRGLQVCGWGRGV